MSKLAAVFPGQGSQYVGMGKDLYEASPLARELYDRADRLLGFPLSTVCFEGPEAELKQTRVTQPAIFVHSIVAWRMLRMKDVSMAAGHSLGEYSALVAAGALEFDDALALVRIRGELMQKAGEENPGTMAAVIGLEPAVVGEVCCSAWKEGIVQSANFNSPGQIVISGSHSGVQKAMELAKTRGARIVKELVVGGAFHSPLMQSARDGLRTALAKVPVRDAQIPVYANVTAMPVLTVEEIRRTLEEQLTSPVRWWDSVDRMVVDGATTFLEVGPGKVLQGLIKRINGSVSTIGVDRFEDLEKLVPA